MGELIGEVQRPLWQAGQVCRAQPGSCQHYWRGKSIREACDGPVANITQHIDYSLYEVLPMAITADFIMAVAVQPSNEKARVRIANLNSEKFPTREFEIPDGEIPIDASEHEWTNYFKSGLKGVSQLLQKKRGNKFASVGMDIVCDGTVPSGGGLSSSASVVCTSALAVLAANGEKTVDKKELCELAIVSERAVGVNAGGHVL
jgi:galactokinase